MVSKFPTTINTDSKINALHHAMSSALEGTAIDKPVAFSKLVSPTDVLFIVKIQMTDENILRLAASLTMWTKTLVSIGKDRSASQEHISFFCFC